MNDNESPFPDRGISRESVTVVFLHHFGGSSRTWQEVISRLRKFEPEIRCIAPDLRGFGDSGLREASHGTQTTDSFNYRVDAYADEVEELLHAEGVNRFLLVGHSMGGKIAMALAARRPAGLEGVLLIAPSPPTPEPMSDSDRERLMLAREEKSLALKVVSAITFRPLSSAIQERTIDDILRSSAAAWHAWLEVGSREDISGRMPAINVPVVVLAAGHDTAMSASLLRREVIARIAGSRLVVIPDSAHGVPLDAPAAVVRLLRDLIASVDAMQAQRAETLPRSGSHARERTEYPKGTVRELLATDAVSDPTRRVLVDRLNMTASAHGEFLNADETRLLQAVCARLIPQNTGDDLIDIAGVIDARLASGRGDGWRYDALPNDRETYRLALWEIDEAARVTFSKQFSDIGEDERDQILSAVQHNRAAGGNWTTVPPSRFFEDLLAEASEIYFSHPLAHERIGYVGMADHDGWTRISLNALAPHEPRPLGVNHE